MKYRAVFIHGDTILADGFGTTQEAAGNAATTALIETGSRRNDGKLSWHGLHFYVYVYTQET